MNPRSNIYRALIVNPGASVYLDEQRVYARNLEVPSGNAVGTARGIAHAYSVFASGGRELGLRQETLDLLAAPAIPPSRGFYDECMKARRRRVLTGLHEVVPGLPVRQRQARTDRPAQAARWGLRIPKTGIGYAYVTSQMGTTLTGDPRDVALSTALYAALGKQ